MAANTTTPQMPEIAPALWLRRDNALILMALLGITLLAWAYLVHVNQTMREASAMAAMGMLLEHGWGQADLLMTFLMWAVMMAGMMVPSAMPLVLAFATVNRNRAKRGVPYIATGIFLAGYMVAWAAFSLL